MDLTHKEKITGDIHKGSLRLYIDEQTMKPVIACIKMDGQSVMLDHSNNLWISEPEVFLANLSCDIDDILEELVQERSYLKDEK